MAPGTRISGFLVALTMATFTLGAMGWYAAAGVGFATGLQDDVSSLSNDWQNPEASGAGSDVGGPSFFGIATGVARTFADIVSLTYKLDDILISWGTPGPMAAAIQGMVDFVVGLTIITVFLQYDLF